MPDIQNRFLLAFTPEQLDALAPIEPIALPAGGIVYRQDEPITHLIFIDSGLGSALRHVPGSRQPVEIWTFGGSLGVIGTHTILNEPESFFEYRTRISGTGWRVSRTKIQAAMERDGNFRDHMRALVHTTSLGIAQQSACNVAHSFEQRLCRTLMMIHEAVDGVVPLSRRTLSEMVPVTRSYMYKLAAEKLAGAVAFVGATFQILDVAEVERRACGCFRQVQAARERVIERW